MPESHSNPSLALAAPLVQEVASRNAHHRRKVLAMIPLFIFGLGCAVFVSRGQQVVEPAINELQAMQPARTIPGLQGCMKAARFAAWDGARAGCRGQLTCMRAVGLFFGTQTGKTEEVAEKIAAETGLGAQLVDDVSAADLAGFDGLIVGAPTWHTGADEQRSGTAWDDYLDEVRGLSLSGKPVAVFGTGDSAGYGDNFCDAIEELHSTFEAAGAKMLGYTDPSGYEYQESKSVKDGKFLGLPLDGDNEDDQTPDRVKAWVDQLKSEGMPLE